MTIAPRVYRAGPAAAWFFRDSYANAPAVHTVRAARSRPGSSCGGSRLSGHSLRLGPCSPAPGQQGGHRQSEPTHYQTQKAQPTLDAVAHRLDLDEAAQHGGGHLREFGPAHSALAVVIRHAGRGLLNLRAVLA